MLAAATCLSFAAQPRRAPKMAPIYEEGYYVTAKGDTVRGDIQTNPEDETDFYKTFAFRGKGMKKPRPFNSQRVKAYGFGDRHFVAVTMNEEKLFLERLAKGRLKFYEMKVHGKIDGEAAIESVFFIRDTQAEGEDAYLRDYRKLSQKFYKKALKPYMKDQPMIWSDLDKFTFNRDQLLRSINEFNSYYVRTGN